MEYIVPNVDLDAHECPLAVIRCVDWRFRESDQEYVVKGLGYRHFDLFGWPGSAKEVLKNNGFKTALLEKIVSVSRNLHNVKKFLLLWHWDCGGYGGSAAFESAEAEEEQYQKDLRAVRDILAKELPEDLEIIMAYSRAVPEGLKYSVLE